MQRRSFIKGSAALAATPLLAAKGFDRAAAQDMSGELVLWHGWTGAEADTLNNVVLPAWQAAMPNVTVEALAVPFDQLKNKFSTDAATGGGPDMLVGPLDWVGELATGELIQPLDEMATEEVTGSYIPAVVDALRFDDQLFGLPESFETVALYYNTDLVATPPATTEEVYAMSAEMPEGTYGLALFSNFFHPAGYLFGFGGQLFNEENQSIINSPETVEFLTWLQNFGGSTAKPGLFQQNDDAGISSLFKEGKAAMVINGPWAKGDYEGALGEGKVGVAPLPLISEKGDAPPKPFLGVKHIMMSNNIEGDQAALAFEFMRFFTGPESAGPLAEAAGHLPADTTVDVSADPIAQAFITQGESVTPMPSIPEMGQVWEPAGQMITTVLSGDATPEEAAATAQDTINSAIENMA
jgi:arabinogalactan oligomer / maltooligosaccharide transport system substrate-binding protein